MSAKLFWVILASATCFGCTSNVPDQQRAPAKLGTDGEGLAALVEGNNQFAFDLYHQLGQQPGNKFFSPYSISTALGMTYAGARGNTANEMAQTLHFTLDNDRLHPAFGELIRKIQGADKKRNYQLAVANSLWGNKSDLLLDPKFLRTTQTDYQGSFQFLDFRGDSAGARRTINGWVEGNTNNKIVDLIPPGLLTQDTRLVLVNAVYFKADWSVPFHKETTQSQDFIVPGTPAFKVPMMMNTFTAFYMENTDFQLAQFMYKDNDVSMVVILPKKKDGLPEVEKKLSAKALEQALARVQGVQLQVTLPKFRLTEEFALAQELVNLGMKDAFVPKVADFKGMESGDNPRGSLFIKEVVHKAFVDVDETGTEAAGATAVVGMSTETSDVLDPPPPHLFRADHPFLFVIRHNATGSILFMGRMADPRAN